MTTPDGPPDASAVTSLADTTAPPVTDIVLEGGGVKGLALVGALQPFAAAGYSFARVAGTSAGAVVGAVLAAMQQRNEPLGRLDDIARSLDYARFRDRGRVGRLLGPLGFVADALSVIFERGAYEGDYLHDWVAGVLHEFGVETFGDLRIDDPGGDGGIHHRYRLVTIVSDVSRRRMAHFPWDYADYGLDPDEQPVADAVRASASLPYFFEPVDLKGSHGTSTLVDGGLLSNYPITVFDRLDEQPARWPTIGVRLDAFGVDGQGPPAHAVKDPASLGIAMVETAIEGCQVEHVLEPDNLARSVTVDTSSISAVDFSLSRAEQTELIQHGRAAGEQFLAHWDYAAWLAEYRPGASHG